jgi:RNA polymerase sigma factor (sigma-70 family)
LILAVLHPLAESDLEDLKKIINDCASGDPKAQETVYRLFAPKMFGVCLRYAKDRTEAEDNLQEAFVKVFTNIKKFRHEGSFEGWIRRIMVNVSLEKYRKQKRLYPVENIGQYEGQVLSESIIDEITARELLLLVQQLSPRYRMVFNLYVFEEMSHQEISKELGISTGTSKSNLARARNFLKRKIAEHYGKSEKNQVI